MKEEGEAHHVNLLVCSVFYYESIIYACSPVQLSGQVVGWQRRKLQLFTSTMSVEKQSFTDVYDVGGAIQECRDHSMNFYRGGPNTVSDVCCCVVLRLSTSGKIWSSDNCNLFIGEKLCPRGVLLSISRV